MRSLLFIVSTSTLQSVCSNKGREQRQAQLFLRGEPPLVPQSARRPPTEETFAVRVIVARENKTSNGRWLLLCRDKPGMLSSKRWTLNRNSSCSAECSPACAIDATDIDSTGRGNEWLLDGSARESLGEVRLQKKKADAGG